MRPRRRLEILLVSMLAGPAVAAAEPMAADGAGCSDRAVAAALVAAPFEGPEYIRIWAKGMQDGSCRGYARGEDVAVDEVADDMSCVRASDDAVCFWVSKDMAPR